MHQMIVHITFASRSTHGRRQVWQNWQRRRGEQQQEASKSVVLEAPKLRARINNKERLIDALI
jgi:hypothetical protein